MPERPSMPESWVSASLTDICEILDHKRVPVNNRERNRRIAGRLDADLYPYFGATGQVGVIDDFIFEGEHILLGEDGAPFLEPLKDQAYLVQGRFWVNNHAHILRSMISNKYVYHYLNTVDYSSYVTGTTRLKLTKNALAAIPIHFPSLAEQQRIVAKIEGLFSELEKGIEILKKAGAQLATYRQAVLKHAFEGNLTAQWREHHRDIKGAKERRHKVLSDRRYGSERSLSRRSRARGRPHQDLVHGDSVRAIATELPTIPGSWSWATVSQIISEELSNGRSVRSAQKGFPVLRLTALRDGEIEQNEYKIGAWTAEDAEPFLIREGDFLVSRGNGSLRLVGRGGLVRSLESPVAYPDTMIRLRISRYVDREFFCYVWNSRLVRRQIETIARTTAGIFKVNQRDLEAAMIPLPPIEEQYVITEEVRCQLAALDHTMGSIDFNLRKARKLRQSILKKAFSGRLVPQEPDDEPACNLLDRIRTERKQAFKNHFFKKTRGRRGIT